MKISHETPIGLFNESVQFNDYEYCLVHLLEEQPEYLKHFEMCRDTNHPFLLDNSIFELGEDSYISGKEKYEYALEQFKYHFVENESNIDNHFIQGII